MSATSRIAERRGGNPGLVEKREIFCVCVDIADHKVEQRRCDKLLLLCCRVVCRLKDTVDGAAPNRRLSVPFRSYFMDGGRPGASDTDQLDNLTLRDDCGASMNIGIYHCMAGNEPTDLRGIPPTSV